MSVIVPVHNHWNLIPPLLAALERQSLPVTAFEILLVNNDAPIPAPAHDWPQNVRVLPCAIPGSYAARNTGAQAARGRWLVFTDADCRPEAGWLAAYAIAGTNGCSKSDLYAGPVRISVSDPAPNPWQIYEMMRGIPQARYIRRGYAATANLMVRADMFQEMRGFDARRFSGGDAEFCRRAHAAGHLLRLVEGAVVSHVCRADWPALAAKARRIKGGQIRAGSWRRRMAWGLRTLAPPLGDLGAYLAAADYPPAHRLTAARVRMRLWGVELAEMARLLIGGAPAR